MSEKAKCLNPIWDNWKSNNLKGIKSSQTVVCAFDNVVHNDIKMSVPIISKLKNTKYIGNDSINTDHFQYVVSDDFKSNIDTKAQLTHLC